MMNKAVLFTAAAALTEQAMAFNPHRAFHHVEKRHRHTDWVSVWHTVYVTPWHGPSVASSTSAAQSIGSTVHSTTVVVAPTTDSTAVVVLPTFDSTSAVVIVPTIETTAVVAPTIDTTSVIAVPTVSDTTVAASSIPEAQPTTFATVSKPATSSTSAPVSTSSVIVESVGFSKRGIVYNDAGLANTFAQTCTNCGWAYNWDSDPRDLDSRLSFVPQLWSAAADHTAGWNANVNAAIAKGSKAIFSFNEPDNAGQANLSPQDAASLHAKWLNPFAGKVQIGAPAITNSGAADEGINWLKSFFTACEAQAGGCAVDFCPVHWYSGVEYAETLFEHLSNSHDACGGRPIWLTEFAPAGSDDQINDFMTTYIPRLDALNYLDAYSYFMVTDTILMTGSNSLSSYGQTYATV